MAKHTKEEKGHLGLGQEKQGHAKQGAAHGKEHTTAKQGKHNGIGKTSHEGTLGKEEAKEASKSSKW